jgi:hypothetical protein
LLKTSVTEKRLVLPNHESKTHGVCHFVGETAKHELREGTLLGHIPGRREEDFEDR